MCIAVCVLVSPVLLFLCIEHCSDGGEECITHTDVTTMNSQTEHGNIRLGLNSEKHKTTHTQKKEEQERRERERRKGDM